MLIDMIMNKCDGRYHAGTHGKGCVHCTYGEYCPRNCEKCLDYIHTPSHADKEAPSRKYDCPNMADFYTCKYSCRYTSEMIYAFQRLRDLTKKKHLKVLSFGCGPCSDLFALDYLKNNEQLRYDKLEYRGIDYSQEVWSNIHADLKTLQNDKLEIKFNYEDACKYITTISEGNWVPDLVTFQYVFSDMRKHSNDKAIKYFIKVFAQFFKERATNNSYIVCNDVNLGKMHGGGRDYFNMLYGHLNNYVMRRGRFRNDHSRSGNTYTYGDDSDGEFSDNSNFFDIKGLSEYSPFDTCASAQMIIKKEERT